jgi:hypothetical protein
MIDIPITEHDLAPVRPTGDPDVDETVRSLREEMLADIMTGNGRPYKRPSGYPSRPKSELPGDSGQSRSH